jgi:hypothetical protein
MSTIVNFASGMSQHEFASANPAGIIPNLVTVERVKYDSQTQTYQWKNVRFVAGPVNDSRFLPTFSMTSAVFRLTYIEGPDEEVASFLTRLKATCNRYHTHLLLMPISTPAAPSKTKANAALLKMMRTVAAEELDQKRVESPWPDSMPMLISRCATSPFFGDFEAVLKGQGDGP